MTDLGKDAVHGGAAVPPVPRNGLLVTFNLVYGLMAVPPCPHEGCGWFMPQLSCERHGNFGMTFLSARRGVLTHVKAVLA